MGYNIEFQIASLIFVIIIMIAVYSRKRSDNLINRLYRFFMFVVLTELVLDIISVIFITDAIRTNNFTFWLHFFSKLYLISMLLFILMIVIYCIMNTLYDGISKKRLMVKYIECFSLFVLFIIGTIFIIINPLLYGGSGRLIYSYGKPSDIVYAYSTSAVIFVVVLLLVNLKKIPFSKFLPILSFCIMEGVIALVQVFNKELLLVGLGSAVVLAIMYFVLENPDYDKISNLDKTNVKYQRIVNMMFPKIIADKILNGKSNIISSLEKVDDVSVMTICVADYSNLAMTNGELLMANSVNNFFSEIDDIARLFKVVKICSYGDRYVVACGVTENIKNSCEEIIKFAKSVLRVLEKFNSSSSIQFKIKIGIDYGSVIAGIFGKNRISYDIIGDVVDSALFLELIDSLDEICVSEKVRFMVDKKFEFVENKTYERKGFGEVKSFFCK